MIYEAVLHLRKMKCGKSSLVANQVTKSTKMFKIDKNALHALPSYVTRPLIAKIA